MITDLTFPIPVTEIIRQRFSKRSFTPKPIPDEIIQQIHKLTAHYSSGIWGNTVQFKVIRKDNSTPQKVKLGTYGFISGATYFIAGTVRKGPHAFEDYGYLLEKIILHLTALGLGTCWLGGTFSRSEFARFFKIDSNTLIPAITPFGYGTPQLSFRESLIRLGARASQRKPWQDMFFSQNYGHPLSETQAGKYALPLEMVRLAPSASNKQPWIIIADKQGYHFFLKRTPGYNRFFKDIDLQSIDMGIAMAHFELTCKEKSLPGTWETLASAAQTEGLTYIVSWCI